MTEFEKTTSERMTKAYEMALDIWKKSHPGWTLTSPALPSVALLAVKIFDELKIQEDRIATVKTY